ncbi:phosphate ABC transporter ATP-binding protein PstB [Olivibacter sitiensis]|uniref:phosphate ABC transporter ATP-binding protein PstB n=1 Tax=Olivibacter sitiensis TaxID=376470 RepID=UPI00040A5A62|nr:phosphate ABC transporter ATP-binding protein PstB [Olivibacter sitiensis]
MIQEKIKLAAHDVNLWFGQKQILKHIDVTFPERKITALIGPSGCGKSTLLRAFNRMHDLVPDARIEGRFLLDNTDLYGGPLSATQVRQRIGMVFQKANPFPKSIYDNVVYGLKINGVPKEQQHEIVVRSLQESYLWEEVKDELNKPAVRLSGGQQQRLCIARTIALRPEVILMDEPCSALDPISTAKIEELILKLKEEYTIVIVTHSMQQAQRIADKTVFMYLGEVVEQGPTASIFNNPQQELTANYVHGRFG